MCITTGARYAGLSVLIPGAATTIKTVEYGDAPAGEVSNLS